jgi:hypothetical protein
MDFKLDNMYLYVPIKNIYFLFNKIRDKGRTDSAWIWGEMAQTMYAHMNK